MNKIIRGKILLIDTYIGKRRGYNYEDTIDTLEYMVTLDNNKKYQTNCSVKDFKIGDEIDIVVVNKEEENIKKDYKNNCIVLNKNTAKKILFDSNFINLDKYMLFISSIILTAIMTKGILFQSVYHIISFVLLAIIYTVLGYITIDMVKAIKNKEDSFSKKDYNLMKKYKKGYIIQDEEYLNLKNIKQKKIV